MGRSRSVLVGLSPDIADTSEKAPTVEEIDQVAKVIPLDS